MRSAFLVLALLLAGCQAVPRPATAPIEAPAAKSVVFRVEASSDDRATIPPGARLEVLLIDDRGAVVAAQSFVDFHGLPHEVELRMDESRTDPERRYALRAALRSASGRLEYFSERRLAVVPGDAHAVPLRLIRASAPMQRH